MNKDQGESSATKPSGGSGKFRSQSRFDELAGKSQSAVGNVKDALSDTADAAASVGDDLAKRGNKVADALQKGASTARDQVSTRSVPSPTTSLNRLRLPRTNCRLWRAISRRV